MYGIHTNKNGREKMNITRKIILILFFSIYTVSLFGFDVTQLSKKAQAQKNKYLPNTEVLANGITLFYSDDFKCSADFGKYKDKCSTQGVTKLEYVKKVINTYLERMPESGKKVIAELKKNQPTMLLFASFEDAETALDNGAPYFFDEMEELNNGKFNAQDLYATETFVSNNNSKGLGKMRVRNAALEEILHLIHNHGISTAYPQWQKRLDDATTQALKKGYLEWEDKNNDSISDDENALPRQDLDDEYLTATVEAYFNQRGDTGYIKENSLCASSEAQCSSKKIDSMLQTNHGQIYTLIQEMFGNSQTFY